MIAYLRFKDTIGGGKGTFGAWLDGQVAFATGLEPVTPIIPVGAYSVSWYFSPKRQKNVYLLDNVPGHSGVEVHIGNQVVDTDGCLLVAQGYGRTYAHGKTDDGIILSTITFDLLKSKVGTAKPWTLLLKEV